jgi:formate hydrogenlyase subunit 6/NADH:ubiquinone oxidoreductase subunit I
LRCVRCLECTACRTEALTLGSIFEHREEASPTPKSAGSSAEI